MTDEFLNTSDALNLLRDTSFETQAPGDVEDTVWERIKGLDPVFSFVEVTLIFMLKDIRIICHIMFTKRKHIYLSILPKLFPPIPR
jgi:hypothetical protein